MLSEIEKHFGAIERKVISHDKDGEPLRSVVLSRVYKTTIEDLWDAVTNKERLPRWFAVVDGELKPGGRFQVEGNAGGKIIDCTPPEAFSITWEFSEDVSWIEVSFEALSSSSARLTLNHKTKLSTHWAQYGPAATGVGWELGLLGLDLYVTQPETAKMDEEKFAASIEGKAFIRGCSGGWADAAIRAGEATEQARNAAARTADFYTGEAGDN